MDTGEYKVKYRINKTNYSNFNTIAINRLPQRSYFIPYPDRASADAVSPEEKRYKSPKVKCLNGIWDFRFYPRPAEIPDVFDTDSAEWDKLDVPSCWQFRGYDKPFYVNTRLQFPYDPPAIPETEKVGRTFFWVGAEYGAGPRWKDPGEEYNFAGIYRTHFDADDLSKRYILSFLGVASCADVYVNGEFAGYSEGSHNTAEFDISGLVREGVNELVVAVRRWCNGTYLECQDMFRNNGIFRDVLLRITDPADIWDIGFRTEYAPGGYRAEVSAETDGDTEVTFTIEGSGLSVQKKVRTENGRAAVAFDDLRVTEWNAERPVLYNLYCETPDACVKVRVGFRRVEIKGDLFLVNGRKIKFHGVNHHDTSCTNGYTLSPQEIERDMRICKEFNIDTVRTSHYPPDPYLLEVCDELGIYVVDEADIEAHADYTMKLPATYNRISHDPDWEEHFMDRAKALYHRDKLHPSIIMWSLGNEAGGYRNQDKMYAYFKRHSELPVHYESAIHSKRRAYDVGSEMYPPVKRVHEIGEKKYKVKELCDRPYFLCEYSHAMGVGPGDMEAYWKEIYSHDNLTGGCVWEMVDHAVLHEDGSYTYGGDHGEWEHDGNFCVDGMFYPDRTPSTGARIAKFIYRPIRIRRIAGDTFEIFNTRAFTDGDFYELRLRWNDGTEETIIPDAGPLSRTVVRLDASSHCRAALSQNRDCLLTVTTFERSTGREAGREQLILLERFAQAPDDAGSVALPDVFGDDPVGSLLEPACAEESDPYTILFRAPTDNDKVFFGLKDSMSAFYCEEEDILSVVIEESRMVVETKIKCARNTFLCTDIYENSREGILVTGRLHCVRGRGDLPRFGKAFRFDSSFDEVSYYGRNGESYADMKDQAQIEEVSCRVADMTEPNIKPQESGNRTDCRWASVSNGSTRVTFTAIGTSFELGIKPYSDEELLDMTHREDEIRTGTYVTISAFQKGIGTGICGPATAPEYCYPARKDYELKFLIKAEKI